MRLTRVIESEAPAEPASNTLAPSVALDSSHPIVSTELSGSADRERTLVRWSSGAGLAVGLLSMLAVLWNLRLDPFRTARVERFGSNFYDLQARALFHGHLDLPYRILGIESFNLDGRTYMYMPPFSAILRMPVLLITSRFDGRLTAPSMLLAWVVLGCATVALVWRVRRLVRGAEPVTRTDAVACGTFIAAVTGGTVLLYIASLPWVYHEVYFWSAACTVAALACFAKLALPRSQTRDIVLLGISVMAVIMTRTTAGSPLAIATVATGAWWALRRSDRRRAAGLMIVAAGVVPLAISALVNWLKFRHPYMIPLEYQQWTEVSARRRLALLINDGSLAGTQFLPTTLVSYFRPDGIRFVPYFPFVTVPAEPARAYAGAFLDQRYRTGSIPAFMPLLFLLAIAGFVTTFRKRAERAVTSMRIPLLGALGVTATMMCFGFIGFRYTSEFVAVLAGAGAIGLAEVTRRMVGRSRSLKQGILVGIGVLAAFSVYANAVVAVTTARTTARGGGLEQFVAWQDRISALTGNPLARRTRLVDLLPMSAPPDELFVSGDCDALYLSTGDLYEPWITVQTRQHTIIAEAAPDGIRPGVLTAFVLDGIARRKITIETNDQGEVRLRFGAGLVVMPTDWQPLAPGGQIELRLVGDTARDTINITFGNWFGDVPLAEWNPAWDMVVTHVSLDLAPVEHQFRTRLALRYEAGPVPELCNRVRDRADD